MTLKLVENAPPVTERIVYSVRYEDGTIGVYRHETRKETADFILEVRAASGMKWTLVVIKETYLNDEDVT